VKALYPGKKIGIIGDKAAAHISEEVLQHAEELGIVIELVFAGMTSRECSPATFGSIEV